MSDVYTLRIDERDVAGVAGETVLDVARENGISVPTLCHLGGLKPFGACRMCVVEIRSTGKLVPACTTKIEEGQDITANSEKLHEYRRQVLELIFTERNHVCSVCVANNHCELQDQAERHGVTHFDLPYLNPRLEVDATHDKFAIDHNRCILCARCVRVCDEIEGAHVWDIQGRGIQARLVTELGKPWGEASTCTSCGKCVQVCPTGALFEKGRPSSEDRQHRPFMPYLRGQADSWEKRPR